METSSVLDSIVTAHSREQVEADLRRLDASVEEHKREEERHREARAEAERASTLLRQVLAYLDAREGGATDRGAEAAEPTRDRINKRRLILTMMREHRRHGPPSDQDWSTGEVRRGLAQHGVEATSNLTRVTLKRMAEAGQLETSEDGRRFRLPD